MRIVPSVKIWMVWNLGLLFWFSCLSDAFSAANEDQIASADDASSASGASLEAKAGVILESELIFTQHISVLFRERCVGCHGVEGREIEGGLDLRSLQGALQGGDSGEPSLHPGNAIESPLYLAAVRTDGNWSSMPPKEAEKLDEPQLRSLKRWIDTGAAWPSAERQRDLRVKYANEWDSNNLVTVATSGGLSAEWTERKYAIEDLWAYQKLANPLNDARKVEGTDPSQSGTEPSPIPGDSVDRLLTELRPVNLEIAPRADRRTLVRRAYYDLTGLPPTPKQVADFCLDPRADSDAFLSLVDQLLESPHYGERMAQHWLDVVRYADSSGFANDFERGNAWRYRDYVVRSFNDDKPFDQFIVEQIAGDELAALRPDMVSESEGRVAAGFLRMGPWELTGMEVAKVARQRFLDDVTNSVGEVFLGHSLQCARCHDHKFDPIPTRDYYSIQAVFANTQLAEPSAVFQDRENLEGFSEQGYLNQAAVAHQKVLDRLDGVLLDNAAEWYQQEHPELKDAYDHWKVVVADLQAKGESGGIFNTVRGVMQRDGFSEQQYPPRHLGFTPQQFGAERVARKGLQRLTWEFERYQPYSLSVYNGLTPKRSGVYQPTRVPDDRLTKGISEATAILTGGDPFAEGERVEPGVLSVIQGDAQLQIPDTIEGKRLAFAHWVASDDNPLTARVIVNRLWLWHFGRALAGNPNNFGAKGKKPTHPRLLDWLALSLIDQQWSIKSIHREIMLSDAYCMSTKHPNQSRLDEEDPENRFYTVFEPRRLSAEELRDSMLAVSGELNREIGGIPCRPEINPEVALQPRQVMGAFASAWVPNAEPTRRHRRSLYILKLRGLVNPMLEVFNSPSPDFSCEQRDASTVTPQVFTLFNSNSTYRRSLFFANNVLSHAADDEMAIVRCFELAYSRRPTGDEIASILSHWRKLERQYQGAGLETILAAPPTEVTREAVEENTGETFRFVEYLYSNNDYIPDLNPSDVDHHTQSLADICLVLFNTNEFVYVY